MEESMFSPLRVEYFAMLEQEQDLAILVRIH